MHFPPDFTAPEWLAAAFAAACLGMSKTGFGGIALVGIILTANLIPAREATGVILPMLILADILAVHSFKKFTVWPVMLRLLAPAVAGITIGWWLMPRIPAHAFEITTGWLVTGLVLLAVCQKLFPAILNFAAHHPAVAWPLGLLAGITTMISNAAGAVVTVYLLAARLPKFEFVGTAAWFFFAANLVKVPFSASLGLITPATLLLNLALAPAVIAGVYLGKFLLGKIHQQAFEWLLLALSLAGSLRLALG